MRFGSYLAPSYVLLLFMGNLHTKQINSSNLHNGTGPNESFKNTKEKILHKELKA